MELGYHASVTQQGGAGRHWRPGLASAVSIGFAVTLIGLLGLFAGYPALQDYGEWIYQATVGASILKGQASQVAEFVSYPVPYSLAQIVMTLLAILMPPKVAGYAFLGLYAVGGALAVDRFIWSKGLAVASSAALLSCLLILSSGFWNGYIGNQGGVILILLYCSISAPRDISPPVLFAFSLLIFSAHAIAFACWVVIAFWKLVSARRVLPSLAVLPAAGLLVWFSLASPSGLDPAGPAPKLGSVVEWVAYKGYTLAKFGGYQNLQAAGLGDESHFAGLYISGVVVNFGFAALFSVALTLVLVRHWRRWWKRDRSSLLAAASLVLVAICLPSFFLGIVNPGERVFAAALVPICGLMLSQNEGRLDRTARLIVCVPVVVGMLLTVLSVCLLPAKASESGHLASTPDRGGAVLFGHRADQNNARIDAADRSFASGELLDLPLLWSTSILRSR